MAMSNQFYASEDFTVCSICFEKFQTPRSLPCTHTFCHHCLSTHIETSCRDSDPPLGFRCPACRAFVPAPGVLRQYPIEDWASRIPENLFLSSCVRKHASLTKFSCGPCEEDGEDGAKVEGWCVECEDFLCEKCRQNHRKYKALKSHKIFSITNYAMDFTKDLQINVLKSCEKHENRNIELVCGTHQTGCCSICVINEHKLCGNFTTLSDVADRFSYEEISKLVEKIKNHLSKIDTTIKKEKMNMSEIDDKTDIFSEMIKTMIEEMVNRLKKMEKTYLDQLAEISKDARQKLDGSLRLLEHRKLYLAHWLEIILTDSQNENKDQVLKCLKTNEVLEALKSLPLIQTSFELSAEVGDGIEKIDFLGSLFSAKITEKSVDIRDSQIDEMVEVPHSLSTNASGSTLEKEFCGWDSSSDYDIWNPVIYLPPIRNSVERSHSLSMGRKPSSVDLISPMGKNTLTGPHHPTVERSPSTAAHLPSMGRNLMRGILPTTKHVHTNIKPRNVESLIGSYFHPREKVLQVRPILPPRWMKESNG